MGSLAFQLLCLAVPWAFWATWVWKAPTSDTRPMKLVLVLMPLALVVSHWRPAAASIPLAIAAMLLIRNRERMNSIRSTRSVATTRWARWIDRHDRGATNLLTAFFVLSLVAGFILPSIELIIGGIVGTLVAATALSMVAADTVRPDARH